MSGSGTHDRTSPLEWWVAGISALLVLGVVASLLHDALGPADTPPHVVIEVDSVVAIGDRYLVQFRARNHGGETAAGVQVEGTVGGGTGAGESSQVTLDYVPARGSRKGGLFFTRDPRADHLEIRALGYGRP